jgi:hypothetical protein
MSTEYVICSHCKKSNPVKVSPGNEQTCIFCGQPFMVLKEKETQLLSDPVKRSRNRIPEEAPREQLEDVNQTKPVNKNKTQPLR